MIAKATLVHAALGLWLRGLACQLTPSFLTSNETITQGCIQSCQTLAAEFGSAYYAGGNDSTFSIWDMKQQEVVHACRVEPTTAAQVSRVLEILLDNWCRFAVKGGGHSTHRDASNSVGGVTIDLSTMDHIELVENSTRANLGPGFVLHGAYTALEEYNSTIVAGRVADVGLPGFTLGGGISNLSPQYGLAVDNIFEYQLVLPNATIVNVSETSHHDLYFALRGGGNNFGIVTNFQARVIPQTLVMGGGKTYHDNYTEVLVEKSLELTTTLANDTYMCFSTRYYWNTTEERYMMSIGQFYYQPILEPAVFDSLNEVPYEKSTIRLSTASNLTADEVAAYGLRRVYATITHEPSKELQQEIYEIYRQEIQGVKNATGFTSSIVVQALHHNAILAMQSRGGNALDVQSDGPLTIVLLTLGWGSSEDDAVMYAYADRWLERVTAAANALDILNPWMYINYANDNQDPFRGYGNNNIQRLREISESIDPKGVFTSKGLCRGSFKVR